MTLSTSGDDATASHKLIFLAGNVWDIHVVGGGTEIFQLLAGKDIDGDEMDLGVTVLSSLGGTHFNDFARAALDYNEAVFAERRALHRVGGRGAGIGALEGMLMLSKMSQSKQALNIHKLNQRHWSGRGADAICGKALTWESSAMMGEQEDEQDKEVDERRGGGGLGFGCGGRGTRGEFGIKSDSGKGSNRSQKFECKSDSGRCGVSSQPIRRTIAALDPNEVLTSKRSGIS